MTIASTLQITPSSCQFQKKINKKFLTIPDRQNQCSKSTKIKTTE